MISYARKRVGRTTVAAVAALAMVLAACAGEGDDGTEPTEAPEPGGEDPAEEEPTEEPADGGEGEDGEAADAPSGDPIVIGGTLGLTGAFSGPSAGYMAAYERWEEEVNSSGGLLGRPVEILIYDDESTPATAQSFYQRLINEDQVDLVLAPYTTFVGGAIIPVVEQNEMVLWNGGFVGIDLFKQSDWIVGAYTYQEPDYPRGIFELIDSLPEDERPSRVGILTAQNPFPLVVREGFEGEGGVLGYAEERGMEIVLDEEYAADATDVSGLIQRARSEEVDLFFSLSLPNDAALIARTAADQGFEPDIYCACGSQVTTLPNWVDLGEAGEGIMATTMAWPTDPYEGTAELAEFFDEELGFAELPSYATVAYGILEVMQQAVEGTGGLDQTELRDYVTGNSFDTVLGTIEYDEDRIPAYNAVVVQFLDGVNQVVWPEDRATGEAVVPQP